MARAGDRGARQRAKRQAAGLCAKCGQEPAAPGERCERCRSLGRRWYRQRASRRWYPFYRKLVASGVDKELARATADSFAHPLRRCKICGIPQWFIYRMAAEDFSPRGGSTNWQRLHLDHIDPYGPRGDLDNIRLLCYHCNNLRERGRYSDGEVRRVAWYYWNVMLPKRQLKWLKEPGGSRS